MISETTLRKRFLKLLRQAHPQRRDTVIAATVSNPQSYLMMKILISVESNFESTIVHLHIGESIPQRLAELSQKCNSHIRVHESPATITGLKLRVADFAARYNSPLCILPLTAEEVVVYLLGELLLGNFAGLKLENLCRTAYPLSTTPLEDVINLVGIKEDEKPGPYPVDPAIQLLDTLRGRIDLPAVSRFYIQLILGGYDYRRMRSLN